MSNTEDNKAVQAIDSLFYLIFSRIFIFLLFIFCILGALRYRMVQGVNCKVSCIGANLSGRDLNGADLNYSNLTQADLQYSNLSGAKLRGTDLSGARLMGVNLRNADLRQAKLMGADLTGADLRNTMLDETDFRGADLSSADFTHANLTTAKLDGVTLLDAKLVEVNLEGVTLAGVSFTGANLTGANLNRTNLNGAGMSLTNLSGCSFINGQLSGSWVNLANFTGANMTNASLAGSQFVGTNLTSANLTGANMVGAILIGSRLNGSTISGANLTGAKIFLAELPPTVFGAAQSDPTLTSLNELRKSELIKNADLGGTTFNDDTLWPSGKMTLLAGMLGPRFHVEVENTSDTKTEAMTPEKLKAVDMGQIQLPLVNPLKVTGDITISGSTVVYPLTNVMIEGFKSQGFKSTININDMGTAKGFKEFCEQTPDTPVDIVDAGRLINPEEIATCNKNGLTPIRLMVGIETIAIVVNPTNEAVSDITTEQFPLLFSAANWSNIVPTWPPNPILRFTTGPENTLYDFLVEKMLNGEEKLIQNSPNIQLGSDVDTVLGVASNEYGLGFIGYNYYQQNTETMKLISINGIYPAVESVKNKTYPLSRPFYLYTDASILQRKPQVEAFLRFYLTYVNATIEQVGYFPLTPHVLDQQEYTLLTALNVGSNY